MEEELDSLVEERLHSEVEEQLHSEVEDQQHPVQANLHSLVRQLQCLESDICKKRKSEKPETPSPSPSKI